MRHFKGIVLARRFSGISLAKWHGVGSILHYIVAGGPLVNGDMYLPGGCHVEKRNIAYTEEGIRGI